MMSEGCVKRYAMRVVLRFAKSTLFSLSCRNRLSLKEIHKRLSRMSALTTVEPPTKVAKNDESQDVKSTRETDWSPEAEALVGITEYVSDHKPFSCLYKKLYEDFVVNEVTRDGKVVYLTETEEPKPRVTELQEKISLTTLLSGDEIAALEKLNLGQGQQVTFDVAHLDKETRKMIHQGVRDHFKNIETMCLDQGGGRIIIARHASKKTRSFKPEVFGFEHTEFFLKKANHDTFEAISKFAKFFHVNPNRFSWAGTKDKRAITTQRVTAYKIEPERIWRMAQRMPNIWVGNFSLKKDPIQMGELSGNQFHLALREINSEDFEVVEKAMQSVKENGFVNYYGLQRFSYKRKNFEIGRLVLQERWLEVIDLILQPFEKDHKWRPNNFLSFNECMEIWREKRDPEEVFKLFYWKTSIEGCLLKGLTKSGMKNPSAGFAAIPRTHRMMYVHGYQSYIWNKAASHRIQKYGLKVVPGDLLLLSDSDLTEQDTDTEGTPIAQQPIIADESHCESASIFDVVLPIPGFMSVLPHHSTGEYYKQLLKEDNLSLEQFDMRSRLFRLKGAYRKLIMKPKDLTWCIEAYQDPNAPVIFQVEDVTLHQMPVVDKSQESQYALIFKTILPSSCYATMLIREMTKTASPITDGTRLKPNLEKMEAEFLEKYLS